MKRVCALAMLLVTGASLVLGAAGCGGASVVLPTASVTSTEEAQPPTGETRKRGMPAKPN